MDWVGVSVEGFGRWRGGKSGGEERGEGLRNLRRGHNRLEHCSLVSWAWMGP